MIITPRCKPIPIPDNEIEVVNKMGKDERILDRIHFRNIHKESMLDDLYRDIKSQDDSSCESDKSWDIPKDGGNIDQKKLCTMMLLTIMRLMI